MIGTSKAAPSKPTPQPVPQLKSLKSIKERIKNIYNDDDFTIDLFVEDKMVRVSIFDGGHYKDEVMVRKDDYKS